VVPIAVDVGIGDTLRAINEILARRESERATVWESLEHQLQAVSLTVGDVDRMYLTLLAEIEDIFMQPPPSGERITAVIGQATTYCIDGRLTLHLAEWRAAIQGAAFNRALKHRRYRPLASALRSIDDPLGRYIERLYRLQDENASNVRELLQSMQAKNITENAVADQQWDLRTVLELLKLVAVRLVQKGKISEGLPDPAEACEEAMRNYNRALSLVLAQLIGHARQELAMESL